MIVFKRLIILLLIGKAFTVNLTVNDKASWDENDNMSDRDKEKIIWLSKELVRDAKLYMRQLKGVVDLYGPLMAFEVGVVMGKIREKLKLMMELYRQIKDRYEKNNKLFGPAIRQVKPLHFIIIMEEIHSLEVDIDKFVSVLENIPIDRWEDDPILASPLPMDKGKPPGRQGQEITTNLPQKTQSQDEKQIAAIQERQYKSKLREQYLMRRLGNPSNHSTTKKRFIDHWPVGDTWSLEQYSLV